MFQTSKFVVTQAKAFEFAQVLAQLAINNAKVVAEIQYDASKNAMTTAQIKAGEILGTIDPKAALQIIKSEDAPVVIAEVSAVHSKVTKVIRKANKEAVELFESAMNESKADLKKMVKEVSAKAPVGSESFVNTFDYLMHVSLQNFDQAYSATKDVHTVFEKSIDGVMSSFQGQFAPDLKPAIQARKAITA